ncbi:HD-GYP domain-containing protein [Brevibacillus gelatini]|uniref:HD-GYP domain-containing protein n=1 Tax=Brevibacillus gelatini TaxID=1655277 RepID=A0A3M8BE44_9BACL|nr:HD-GYP domain-containing protein [Brevibacillus gelatini]RNB61227.1 HD-GYP domain-containing protein [Brevibacillus gelatini]
MRLKSIHKCQPGDKLARSIYAENGTVLVGAGVELTGRMIERLKNKNINSLYIEDKRTDDIMVDTVISESTRRQAMSIIHDTFRGIQEVPQKWQLLFSDKNLGRQLKQVMSAVADELKGNKSAMNLLADACAFDNYIFSHSFNVALYSTALAINTGCTEKEILDISIGGMLHDIGKMQIPDQILKKPGRLTPEEYEVMKKHAEIGFEMLRRQDDIPLLAAHCALQHHERWNGSGYPRKLKNTEIHPYGRLMAVADVFDALTAHRVYRRGMLPHEAMEVLYSGSDILFDQAYVEALRDTIALYPVGLSVTLNTGVSGVVVDSNKSMPSRPVIRVLVNEEGQELSQPYECDLSKMLSLMIVACGDLV